MISFNKSDIAGNEVDYIKDAIGKGHLHGGGVYTEKCHEWFQKELGLSYNLLTTSCSSSLDMSALLIDIQAGDEVIMPSFTFSSTANAFALRGATIKFVDIRSDTMNIDETKIEQAITRKTKAIVPVHYAGISCEMDAILESAKQYNLFVIEDAAQGVHSKYKGKHLGSIGDIGCYSFHASKNYTASGEGGLIVLKTQQMYEEAQVLREKGTNRSQFLNGVVDKYTWVGLGSSYLPSEISAAYLYGQLEKFDLINDKRLSIWDQYYEGLRKLQAKELVCLPYLPSHCEHNAHMFYVKLQNKHSAESFIRFMREKGVVTPFHYPPLHLSKAGKKYGAFVGEDIYTSQESAKLVRLPLYYGLSQKDVDKVISLSYDFFKL